MFVVNLKEMLKRPNVRALSSGGNGIALQRAASSLGKAITKTKHWREGVRENALPKFKL
jgi:hypothetical protein